MNVIVNNVIISYTGGEIMITYKVLDNTIDNANKLEFLRLSSYGFTPTKEDYDDYYINNVCRGNILPIVCYYDDKLIAGCYVSNTFDSIYIDYLFVLLAIIFDIAIYFTFSRKKCDENARKCLYGRVLYNKYYGRCFSAYEKRRMYNRHHQLYGCK